VILQCFLDLQIIFILTVYSLAVAIIFLISLVSSTFDVFCDPLFSFISPPTSIFTLLSFLLVIISIVFFYVYWHEICCVMNCLLLLFLLFSLLWSASLRHCLASRSNEVSYIEHSGCMDTVSPVLLWYPLGCFPPSVTRNDNNIFDTLISNHWYTAINLNHPTLENNMHTAHM